MSFTSDDQQGICTQKKLSSAAAKLQLVKALSAAHHCKGGDAATHLADVTAA